MKKLFPSIKINNISKKIFSIDLAGGGTSPSTLSISFLTDSREYYPNTQDEYRISIGSFYDFVGYLVAVNKREGASGFITELKFIDTSIKLDKIFVGLKGKHGPIQPALPNSNMASAQFVDMYQLTNTVFSTATPSNTINSLAIFESFGSFPFENLILLGEAKDPCKDIEDKQDDFCDPCSEVDPNLLKQKYDCEKNRAFQILDVDYKFSDLIIAAGLKGIVFNNTFNQSNSYRAQYTGTLREVLSNWCKDFGYTFYWDNNSVNFINTTRGIEINDSAVQSESCSIEDKSTSISIEGINRKINIAYFGKAGEIKEYNCNEQGTSESSNSSQTLLESISLSDLMFQNRRLLSSEVYKNENNFRAVISAGQYSKELRDLYCWSKIYGYDSPQDVKIGKHSILGLNIKAICHADTQDSQTVSSYSSAICRVLYNQLLTAAPQKGSFFSKENIEKLKKMGAYFIIAQSFGSKAYEFEREVASIFCGKYWIKSINSQDVEPVIPDGNYRIIKGSYANSDYAIPNLNVNHPYIKSSGSRLIKRIINQDPNDSTLTILLDRPQYWSPDENDPVLNDFIETVLKFKIEEIESPSSINLEKDDKIFLVCSFGNDLSNGIKFNVDFSNKINIIENTQRRKQGDNLGLRGRICKQISFNLNFENESKTLEVQMPCESPYLIGLKKNQSQYTVGPIKAIIPKFEAVITEDSQSQNVGNYMAVDVNYQDITDADLSKLNNLGGRCFIDKNKVYTYARSILNDISNNITQERKTINYTLIGLPESKITPKDGLTSFSVRMDSAGTRTTLSFSNSFPENFSDTFKKSELTYLLKNQANKNYRSNSI